MPDNVARRIGAPFPRGSRPPQTTAQRATQMAVPVLYSVATAEYTHPNIGQRPPPPDAHNGDEQRPEWPHRGRVVRRSNHAAHDVVHNPLRAVTGGGGGSPTNRAREHCTSFAAQRVLIAFHTQPRARACTYVTLREPSRPDRHCPVPPNQPNTQHQHCCYTQTHFPVDLVL